MRSVATRKKKPTTATRCSMRSSQVLRALHRLGMREGLETFQFDALPYALCVESSNMRGLGVPTRRATWSRQRSAHRREPCSSADALRDPRHQCSGA